MTIEPIASNRTKLINSIFERATEATCYTLGNEFRGESVEPAKLLEMMRADKVKGLTWRMTYDVGARRYTVRYHSNRWYYVKSEVVA